MMRAFALGTVFALVAPFCGLTRAEQVYTTLPPLELQDVNFVHTSDIHSWFRGHRRQGDVSKSWNANIGDVVSFVHHMRSRTKFDQDVFFVDSGDQTHGGGLSDADSPAGAKTLAIHLSLPYDVMTPGNHELEDKHVAENLYKTISGLPKEQRARYLTSNVFFADNSTGVPHVKDIGERYRKWKTPAGRNVVALGLNFDNSAKTKGSGIIIQSIASMVNEKWFSREAFDTEPDLVILVGHMSLSDKNDAWPIIHGAIREKYKNVPIFIFAGHSHNRDCSIDFDAAQRSIAIESGRYLETVGWVSADLPKTGKLSFTRRFLDPSKDTFQRHARVDGSSFITTESNTVMARFDELARSLNLDEFYGCADKDYPWDHAAYDHPDHMLRFYLEEAFPGAVVTPRDNQTASVTPYFLLVNNGFIRGPIYKGEFTKDDMLVNTPYRQEFRAVKIPRIIAEVVHEYLDHVPNTVTMTDVDDVGYYDPDEELQTVHSSQLLQQEFATGSFAEQTAVVPGYVTDDSCKKHLGPGDDVYHSPALKIQFPPRYVFTKSKSVKFHDEYALVDYITIEYLEKRVQTAINSVIELHNDFCKKWGPDLCPRDHLIKGIGRHDWRMYSRIGSNEVVREYAKRFWTPQAHPSGEFGRC